MGTTSSVSTVDDSTPPITATAMGARNDAPMPVLSAVGSIPNTIAALVISTGRSRRGPAFRIAASGSSPSSRM